MASFPSSYIPTTTAAATRAADVAVMTGANFSDWYRADEGTVVVEGEVNGARPSTYSSVAAFVGDNDDTDIVNFYFASQSLRPSFNIKKSDVKEFDASGEASTDFRMAAAYAANDGAFSASGSAPYQEATLQVPVVNRLVLAGNSINYQPQLACHIRRLAFFPARLPNATLQALTTE